MEGMKHKIARVEALWQQVKIDADKALRGNKAAGTRARQGLQEIKAEAQELRKGLLAIAKGQAA